VIYAEKKKLVFEESMDGNFLKNGMVVAQDLDIAFVVIVLKLLKN